MFLVSLYIFSHGVDNIDTVLLNLNDCIGTLLDRLTAANLFPNNMNLILLSDHGMINFTAEVITVPTREDLYEIKLLDYAKVLLQPLPGTLKIKKKILTNFYFGFMVF